MSDIVEYRDVVQLQQQLNEMAERIQSLESKLSETQETLDYVVAHLYQRDNVNLNSNLGRKIW